MENSLETIIFGGGCFWCTEAIFENLRGVTSVTSGYAGGETENPTYDQVCTGKTGHAETIKVDFDPEKIALSDLLDVFFALHDPTTPNQQGADRGTEYRSIILTTNSDQEEVVKEKIAELNKSGEFASSIVTEVKPLTKFFPAEDFHQKFADKNSGSFYCQVVINPKLAKLRQKFGKLVA